MCNTREENAAEMAQETAVPVIPITRAALIEKLVDCRTDDFDGHDIVEAVQWGRIGYEELSNGDLEQLAIDFMMEEDGNEVRYTITDADTSKPSAHELLEALKELTTYLREHVEDTVLDDWKPVLKACITIAKAEGK